jgi:hypothetical protein
MVHHWDLLQEPLDLLQTSEFAFHVILLFFSCVLILSSDAGKQSNVTPMLETVFQMQLSEVPELCLMSCMAWEYA